MADLICLMTISSKRCYLPLRHRLILNYQAEAGKGITADNIIQGDTRKLLNVKNLYPKFFRRLQQLKIHTRRSFLGSRQEVIPPCAVDMA